MEANKIKLDRSFELRKEEDQYTFQLSNETVDRHGTIIKSTAWNLDSYKKNPVVLYMHNSSSSDPDDVIGRGEVYSENDRLYVRVYFDTDEENKKAQKIKRKVDNGLINATSVGFVAKKGHWGEERSGENEDIYYFDDVELLEASIVVVPSNPEATKKQFERYLDTQPKPEKEQETQEKRGIGYFEARYKHIINK